MLARSPSYAEDQSGRHALLWACFRSGQMDTPQLLGHMGDDPAFKAFVELAVGASAPRRYEQGA